MSKPTVRSAPILVSFLSLLFASACTDSTGLGGPEVEYVGYRAARCASSASPLPGYRTCSVVVAVTIHSKVSSGTISVFFNYPDQGSFYHGELSGLTGFTGTKEITLTNGYVSSCPKIQTSVEIYDGPQSAQVAPLLLSLPAQVGPLC